ncbi:MAG: hypothetical protein OXG49_13690 [Chloroflexi bacterium]|nr:hypothetical protein [Chloroflexota bacterium]
MSETSRPMISTLRNLPSWAKALAAAALLTLALIAANLIYASQLSHDHIPEGSPGTLLYVSAFSGFSDEWDLYDGQQSAKVVDEQLELKVTAPQTATWSSTRPRFREFDLSVSVTATAGPIDNAMGVVFQAQSLANGACELPAVILCGIDQLVPLAGAAIRQAFDASDSDVRLAFLISSDGYYSLRKVSAGQTRLLSAWIATPHIKQGLGMANTIRIIARDSSYRFLINGAPVSLCIPLDASATSTYYGGECIEGEMRDSYRPDSFKSGKLGLIAQSTATGGGGVVVRFDNLLVFSPAAAGDGDAKL